jgi:hypothetical protein
MIRSRALTPGQWVGSAGEWISDHFPPDLTTGGGTEVGHGSGTSKWGSRGMPVPGSLYELVLYNAYCVLRSIIHNRPIPHRRFLCLPLRGLSNKMGGKIDCYVDLGELALVNLSRAHKSKRGLTQPQHRSTATSSSSSCARTASSSKPTM